MYQNSYQITINTPNTSLFTQEVNELLKNARKEIDKTLNIDSRELKIPLTLIEGEGYASKDGVYLPESLDEYHPVGKTTQRDAFVAYFKHETTHFITQKLWENPRGAPPAFINEGVAQYASEYFYVKAALGFGYDEIVNGMIKKNKYIPLLDFLASNKFLEYRMDSRVLCENASFIGFLLRTYGNKKLQMLFETALIPTKDDYKFHLLSDFKRIYNADLDNLENQWKIWLGTLEQKEEIAILVEKFSNMLPEFKNSRCGCCSDFLREEIICPNCGFDSTKTIAFS